MMVGGEVVGGEVVGSEVVGGEVAHHNPDASVAMAAKI